MKLTTYYLTHNDCYKAAQPLTPKGILVHSTGCNNPNLKRYVGPDDGVLGVNQYSNHWNQPTPDGKQVCVHAFIGKDKNGEVRTYQTLPWNIRGWHAGGSANTTHLSFEICEDALTDSVYFNAIYHEAVELCAYLSKLHNLDPTKNGVLIAHYEGYKLGITSNHGDPGHWFTCHGKSMDTFRSAVSALMDRTITQESYDTYTVKKGDTLSLGVDIWFEEQNIHTMSADGELMLTILASYYQEESLSMSENCKWQIRRRFADGEIVGLNFMFGYIIANGRIKFDHEQAEIVELMYSDYISGMRSMFRSKTR